MWIWALVTALTNPDRPAGRRRPAGGRPAGDVSQGGGQEATKRATFGVPKGDQMGPQKCSKSVSQRSPKVPQKGSKMCLKRSLFAPLLGALWGPFGVSFGTPIWHRISWFWLAPASQMRVRNGPKRREKGSKKTPQKHTRRSPQGAPKSSPKGSPKVAILGTFWGSFGRPLG